MNKITTPYYIILIIFAIAFFIYGGYDDSPGAQLLGLIVVIIGVIGITKKRKNS